jgi:exonuclease III
LHTAIHAPEAARLDVVPRSRLPVLVSMIAVASVLVFTGSPSRASQPSMPAVSTTAPAALKYMTYNVCITEPWCSDASGAASLSTRKSRIYSRVKASAPDVLAIQEGSGLFNGVSNMKYTSSGAPKPVISPSSRDGAAGSSSKYFRKSTTGADYRVAFDPAASYAGVGIYVNAKTLDLVITDGKPAVKTVALGTDPEIPGNGKTERRTPRSAIFAQVSDKSTGRRFWVGDLHTTEGSTTQEKAARLSQVEIAADTLTDLGGQSVLLGDFNESRTTSTDRVLDAVRQQHSTSVDAMDIAPTLQNVKNNSYQGWKATPRTSSSSVGVHIDRAIFSSAGWTVTKWATGGVMSKGRWKSIASDHIPVVVVASAPSAPGG